MRIESTHLRDIAVIVPDIYEDDRGYFMETFREDQFRELGLPTNFVQDNHSFSRKGVIRGLHFQWSPPMGKLMRVTRGVAFLVAVDVRPDSPTVGQWFGIEVSDENKRQVWAPAGFARGFCALTDQVHVQYKCTGIYNSKAESAIRWDDSDIGIKWPLRDAIISAKDKNARSLGNWLASDEASHFAIGPVARSTSNLR